MAARINEVRDAIVTRILENWSRDAGDEVSGLYRVDIEAAADGGRKVYVFPLTTVGAPIDRFEDQNDYGFGIWIVEKYPKSEAAGDPPESWIDERVAWVEWLWKLLGNPRGPRLLADPEERDSGLWPAVAEINTVYDHDLLIEAKTFGSALTLVYREHAEGP